MSQRTSGNGTGDESVSHLRTVTAALREIATDGECITLAELVDATGLDRADAEAAMGSIERIAPVSAQRLVEPGADVAWKVSL